MAAPSTFQRARRPEQKQQRRDAILEAAARLATAAGVRAVTLTDIADAVGIHKSALLRYFETREEIFLEVTAASWHDWSAAVHAGLDVAIAPSGRRRPRGTPTPEARLVAGVLARSFAERPLLCDLIPHTALHLERNVSVEAVRRYKRQSLAVVTDAAGLVAAAVPELSAGEARELVSTMASLAGALWQISNAPPALLDLYASDPQLAGACVELESRLERTALVLLAGLPASRPRGTEGPRRQPRPASR